MVEVVIKADNNKNSQAFTRAKAFRIEILAVM